MVDLEDIAEIPLELVEAELCRRSFKYFVRRAWPLIDPAPLVENWHLDAIADHLQAVTEGQLRNLLISMPPGHAKSMLVSVLWPAWAWIRNPAWKAIFASYADDLVVRDATKSRTLILTRWYQTHFARKWRLADDQNRKDYFRNSVHGERMCISVSGQGTGFRGDAIVVDDPMKADDAHSEAKRRHVLRWWSETMPSRLNDLASGAKVVIAQRLHENDLPGFILAHGGFEHLNLPTEYSGNTSCYVRERNGPCEACARGATAIGFKDPRTSPGELLFPAKFGPQVITEAKRDLGSFAFSAQHQQRPIPEGGGMLKRAWWRHLWRRPGEAPVPAGAFEEGLDVKSFDPDTQRFDSWCMALDATFKDGDDNDLVALGVGARLGADIFLLDMWWERAGFVRTCEALQAMAKRWPKATTKLIEDKANGSAIIETLRSKVSGILPVNPAGGKVARVAAASPYIEAGNVWLPMHAPWRNTFVGEACSFPNAPHDDGIDMLSYLILRLGGRIGSARLAQLVTW